VDQHLSIEHVQVQTISWCNRSCAFCPSQKFDVDRALMPLSTYERLLDELRAIPFRGRFSPYLMNESLLDVRLASLLRMARDRLPGCFQFISTNGDALDVRRGVELFEAGLDSLTINCYDSEAGRLDRLTAIAAAIADRVPNVRLLDGATPFRTMVTPGAGERWPRICVRDCRRFTIDTLDNIAGNVPGARLPAKPIAASCYRPFVQLHIRYNGDVVLCHCDWKGEVVFGNIGRSSLDEIYNSSLARRYRDSLTRADRRLPLCARCDFGGSLD